MGEHSTYVYLAQFETFANSQAELLRVSRINYSEGVELLVHLKVVRGFVESVLRYGLPASYFSAFIKVGNFSTSW